MAGKQLAALSRRLRRRRLAGRHAGLRGLARRLARPARERAHRRDLASATVLQPGRPTVVTVGVGARRCKRDRLATAATAQCRLAETAPPTL